jgi:hypothetical protein
MVLYIKEGLAKPFEAIVLEECQAPFLKASLFKIR